MNKMPFGGTTSGQDKKIDSCVMSMMADKKFAAGMDGDKRKSKAIAICKSSVMGKKEDADINRVVFEYHVPIDNRIIETTTEGKEFLIAGTAITETTSRNGRTYVAEELQKAAPGLAGKKLLKDHNNSVDSIVGRVKEAYYDSRDNSIKFRAKIVDEHMQKLIKSGVLDTVSIGANAESVEEIEKDGQTLHVMRGLEFMELSLVAVEGVPQATFAMVAEKLVTEKDRKQFVESTQVQVEELNVHKINEEVKEMVEDKVEIKQEITPTVETKATDITNDKIDKLTSLIEAMATLMVEDKKKIEVAPVQAEKPIMKAEVGGAEETENVDLYMIEKNDMTEGRPALTMDWTNPDVMKKLGYGRTYAGLRL